MEDRMEEEFDFIDIELLNMNLAITRLSLASIHAAEGKLDAAISEYTKVLEFDPDLYLVYFNRGKLFWRKGEREKAREDFNRAIMLEPGVAITYICRGDIFFDDGDYSSAREDYCKALELSPANKTVIERMEKLQKKRRK
jgi:tetratricopeptide (TPR) repeat protein